MSTEIKRNYSILVVDDEEPVLSVIKIMAQRIGHKVVTQSDSQEALRLFRDQPDQFDIVFTDLQMPQMNGIELSRAILQLRPDMPIILCTGYPTDLEKQKAIEVGIKEFLLKPFTTHDFILTLEKLF